MIYHIIYTFAMSTLEIGRVVVKSLSIRGPERGFIFVAYSDSIFHACVHPLWGFFISNSNLSSKSDT